MNSSFNRLNRHRYCISKEASPTSITWQAAIAFNGTTGNYIFIKRKTPNLLFLFLYLINDRCARFNLNLSKCQNSLTLLLDLNSWSESGSILYDLS